MELVDVILHHIITVKLTSGLLFEFQHIKCMDTDVIDFGQECESITNNESLMCFSRWNHVEVGRGRPGELLLIGKQEIIYHY